MAKRSAGILIYRHRKNRLEVFLVHPVDHIGLEKTMAHGLYQRVNIKKMMSHCGLLNESSMKKQD